MDGLVTKEAITKDLEAFKAAGLAGVQNFQIGGDGQIRVGDPTCAIGSEKWKGMMRWAMDECQRLGLTFGTHNCPGWSSSAYPTVTPEYSMQKLIFSETKMPDVNVTKGKIKQQKVTITLPRPEIDAKYNYYEDICVLALPNDSIIRKESIVNLTEYFDRSSQVVNIPSDIAQSIKGHSILRFGHTTNGKTNQAQAPEIIAYADKASIRLQKRYYHLISAGKNRNVAITAVARELSSFIWGMMTNHTYQEVKTH